MSPALSIVIPTFKRKDSLQKLLKALLGQKEVSPEIIVVDQNPAGFLSEILSTFPTVKHMLLPVPNASSARNQGFMASSGEVVLFIDDDLIPEEDFCIKAINVFRSYQAVNCFSPLVYTVEGKEMALKQALVKKIDVLKDNSGIFSLTDTISAAIFFKREYFEESGGFDPILFEFARTAEDQEFFIRMKKKNQQLYFVPFVEVYHDENITGGCELRTSDYWITREKCMKSWAFRYRIHHNPPGRLSVNDLFQLARSGFLNKEVLFSGINGITRQIGLLLKSIRLSNKFLKEKSGYYSAVETINHLVPKKV